MSSQSKAPIPPNSSTKPRVSRKVVVSARMSQQDINVLKADIESAARAVASVRETSRLLGSALSAHSSQFPESIDLTEKWAKIDAAYYDMLQACQTSAIYLATKAQMFSDKLPGYGPSGYSVEKNQKRIATFVTTLLATSQASLDEHLSTVTRAIQAFESLLRQSERKERSKMKDQVDSARYTLKKLQRDMENVSSKTKQREFTTESSGPDIITDMLNVCKSVQRALEYPFADIDDRNYDLRYNYGNGVLRSIEVFELVQQGLVREAQEIQKWLALEDPTPENAPAILNAATNTETPVFVVFAEALRLYNVTAASATE